MPEGTVPRLHPAPLGDGEQSGGLKVVDGHGSGLVDYPYSVAHAGWAVRWEPPGNGPRADPPLPLGWSYYQGVGGSFWGPQTTRIRQPKPTPTAVIRLKATYTDPPTMARSKSKNKTLAVGDTAHARISEIQKSLGLKNHDETIRHLLDYYCSSGPIRTNSLGSQPSLPSPELHPDPTLL
jgi:hypothetical protein